MTADFKRASLVSFVLIFLVGTNCGLEDATGKAGGNTEEISQLQTRGLAYESLSFGLSWNGNNKDKGDFMEFTNYKGLNIRVIKNTKPQNVFIRKDGSISVNGKVVCADFTKLSPKESYQKAADGSWWRTNLQIGEPLTTEDIEAFDSKWTRYEDDEEERERKFEDRAENAAQEREERRRRRVARETEYKRKDRASRRMQKLIQ